jgi:hypothetical protein
MSWQNRYLLPWPALDRDRIRAAVEHVMRSGAGLDLRRYEIEDRGEHCVCVFFYFEARVERGWGTGPSVKRTFGLYAIADTDEGNVQIDFGHIPPGNEYDLPVETYFEFYSNVSGNYLFSGVGMEIAERIGRYFGVKCELQ